MPNQIKSGEYYLPTVEDCLHDPTDFSVEFNDILGPTLSHDVDGFSTNLTFNEALKCALAIEGLRQLNLERYRREEAGG